VEIIGHYSNTPRLLPDLRRTLEAVTTMVIDGDQTDITATAPADRRWRIKDRLTQSDLDQLVASFGQGTAIPELAERYGVSPTSIKTILRHRGTRRRPKRRPPT
jgi:hypothetical protein